MVSSVLDNKDIIRVRIDSEPIHVNSEASFISLISGIIGFDSSPRLFRLGVRPRLRAFVLLALPFS